MRQKAFLYFSGLLLLAIPAANAEAARLTLKNGDTLSGTISDATGLDTLQFKTPYGRINVPWEDVAKLRNDHGQDVKIPTSGQTDTPQGYLSPVERSRRYLASLAGESQKPVPASPAPALAEKAPHLRRQKQHPVKKSHSGVPTGQGAPISGRGFRAATVKKRT